MRRLLPDEQVRANKRRTILVMFLMGLLLLAIVFAAGVLIGLPWPVGLGVAVVASVIYLLITTATGVKAVIGAAGCRPANPNDRLERLFTYKLEELSIASGLPVPKAYVQDSRDINAFAAGRNPKEAIVCVTRGALEQLNQEELEGVLAHEMSHIKNYDVRLATITLAVVGAIALLAEIVLRVMWYGGHARGGRGKGGGPAQIIILVIALVFLILAPIFSRMVYFALSRRREYLADASGVMLTRNPDGLAGALEKILHDLPDDPKGSRTVAGLYIANPWTRKMHDNLFATHPPLEKRISILRFGTPNPPPSYDLSRQPR